MRDDCRGVRKAFPSSATQDASYVLARERCESRTIQHWFGHKSLETTMKYLGVKDSAGLQKEINLPMY